MLRRLRDGGSGSKTRIVAGSGFNPKRGKKLLDALKSEELISIKPLARSKWVSITHMGRLYLKEFDRFLNIIEILNKEKVERDSN